METELYGLISEKELTDALITAKWYLTSDNKTRCEESSTLSLLLNHKQSIAGKMDYKDHRNDSLNKLKKLALKSIKVSRAQRIHFYKNGKIFNAVSCNVYCGGWSIYPLFI